MNFKGVRILSVLAFLLFLQSCKTELKPIGELRSSSPNNVQIDFQIINKPKNITLNNLNMNKITIYENDVPLSTLEGQMASVVECQCSVNIVHLTVDYSGSVRRSFEQVMAGVHNFVLKLYRSKQKTLIRISFFAGDEGLYNPTGYNNYYFTPDSALDYTHNPDCRRFTLNGDKNGKTLCDSDNATRLNTAFLTNLNHLNWMKGYVKDRPEQFPNPNFVSIIFTDGRNTDVGVSTDMVAEEVVNFKKNTGKVYAVSLDSKEFNSSYFAKVQPTKQVKFKKLSKFSNALTDAFDDFQNNLPAYYTLRICSASRGGFSKISVESKTYKIPKFTFNEEVDSRSFTGECDLSDESQWKF